MRVVAIGAILALVRHTMADLDARMEKLPGALVNAFMPAVATPQGASQTHVHPGAPGVVTDGAPMANLPVSNPNRETSHLRGESFKLQEVASLPSEMFNVAETNHDMETELQGVRSQRAVTSPLTHAQTMPIAAHWRSIIYGCFGYGVGVVVLLSIVYKFFYKRNHRTPLVSRNPSAMSFFQPTEAISRPLFASNGELRTSGVAMQGSPALVPNEAGSRDMRPGFAQDRDMRPIPGRGSDGGEPFVHVQGQSLRTWSFPSADPEQVQVLLRTEGRPLDAAVELWHGPDNTPTVMRVYVEDGFITPFSAVIATPRSPNTVAVRNIGQVEFPLSANVFANNIDVPTPECLSSAVTVQGGAVRTFAFHPEIDTVQVLLTTDGRPLNCRIELLQGPTNEKQIIELYNDDGLERPFFGILNSPGSGSVIRIVNTGPIEFPMSASVVPYFPP